MKQLCVFLVLCAMPVLLCAFDRKACDKMVSQVSADWNLQSTLRGQAHAFWSYDKQEAVRLMRESIASGQRALERCNEMLKKIARLSKGDRRLPYWKNKQEEIERSREALSEGLRDLQQSLDTMLGEIIAEKALPFYHKSEERAKEALAKSEMCPQLLGDIRELITTLTEVRRLYEEAASFAQKALDLMTAHPAEAHRNALKQAILAYKEAASVCEKEAAGWEALISGQVL